jgi:F-type H+-transporting ATPase subunit gamma
MSQLIHLKQRLEAIETIKKITNAMRVISMSMHSKLGNKLDLLTQYQKELNTVLYIVKKACDQNIKIQSIGITPKKLLIVIGSDKGLCGTFNSGIIKKIKEIKLSDYTILTVGKKITDYIQNKSNIKKSVHNLTYKNLTNITADIFNFIEKESYTEITCISTKPESFFIQTAQKQILFPVNEKLEDRNIEINEYIWQEAPLEIYKSLQKEYLKFSISQSLFESLFAEQAARFQSMDSATRNAENILEQMQIQYSKLRQTKITQEINELTSHF